MLAAALSLALAAAAPGDLARGAAVARRFCYACHDEREDGRAANPLQPKLAPERWGTPEQAYRNIGRLSSFNAAMIVSFTGSDADRRALALYVADLAAANRPPLWRVALAPSALALALLAAFAWARARFAAGARAARARCDPPRASRDPRS